MMKLLATSVLVAVALALGACGNDDDDAESTPETSVVPDLVGVPLDEAKETLDELPLGFQALGPNGPVTSDLSGWEVCGTAPPPGLELPSETRIELVVARSGRC